MKKALQGLIFFVFLFSVNVLQADEKTEKKIKVTINSAELTEYVKVPSAPITEPIRPLNLKAMNLNLKTMRQNPKKKKKMN